MKGRYPRIAFFSDAFQNIYKIHSSNLSDAMGTACNNVTRSLNDSLRVAPVS